MLLHGILNFSGGCVAPAFSTYEAWGSLFALIGLLFAHGIQVMTCCVRRPSKDDMHLDFPASQSHNRAIKAASLISLEIGIAFHSILIGLTLGTTAEGFSTLLLAIAFHQFFEGLAISSVHDENDLMTKNSKTMMMALYILSTPFGIVLGIIAHRSCNS
jgi:zinc transporter 1/2/3